MQSDKFLTATVGRISILTSLKSGNCGPFTSNSLGNLLDLYARLFEFTNYLSEIHIQYYCHYYDEYQQILVI